VCPLHAQVGADAAAAVAAAAAAAPGSAGATSALRSAFNALMSLPPAAAAAAVTALTARLEAATSASPVVPLTSHEALALRLQAQYPNDVGVLAAFFLNHVTLRPGAAVALAANAPHAYLAGQCVEIMATSDNVVRAGLTPKLRDVPTLAAMLRYDAQGAPDILYGKSSGDSDGSVRSYEPGFDEFALDAVTLTGADAAPGGAADAAADASTSAPPPPAAAGVSTVTLRPSGGASLLLVASGSGEARIITASGDGNGGDASSAPVSLAAGGVFYVPPGAALALTAGAGGLRAFRARVSDAALA
jgi:mannose-6-phosphate isomerase